MQKPMFRNVAVGRVFSPDQLDGLMQVTTLRGWLVLAAVVAIITVAVLWGIWGRIPSRLVGQGILIRTGGVNTIAATDSGQLVALHVRVGDSVQPGQTVAEIVPSGETARTPVLSPYTGRVIEIALDEGSQVERGTLLLSLVDESRPLEAVIYLPPTDGKKVQTGMPVNVSPSTVAQEEYGFLRGVVSSVGELPATYEGMYRVLKNNDLVEALAAGGTPIEVRVTLTPDPTTPSGYAWSSPQGPPFRVENGTLAQATITIGEQRPISLVLPFVK